MTMPSPDNHEPMTLAEQRAMQERQDQRLDRLAAFLERTAQAASENTRAAAENTRAAAENTRAIAEMRAAQKERDARHDQEMAAIRAAQEERDTRHDQEMAAIHAAQEERDTRHDREMAAIHAAREEHESRHDQEMAAIHAAREEHESRHDREMTEIRAAQKESEARHNREMAEIRAAQSRTEKIVAENSIAIAKLQEAQYRTNQDVATLKGWELELLCERRPELLSDGVGLETTELVPKKEMYGIANAAFRAGVITENQRRDLMRADGFFYGRGISDLGPACLVVEASFQVSAYDVDKAVTRADLLAMVLEKYQPRNLNGRSLPVVVGTSIEPLAAIRAEHLGVTYVPIQNGNRISNPPE